MATYTALCSVPRKYIDVEITTNRYSDEVEFWGQMTYSMTVESSVDSFAVDTLGFLHSPKYKEDEAVELHNHDRQKMNIKFKFDCDAEDSEAAGDWLEAKLEEKLALDWHIDEVLEA